MPYNQAIKQCLSWYRNPCFSIQPVTQLLNLSDPSLSLGTVYRTAGGVVLLLCLCEREKLPDADAHGGCHAVNETHCSGIPFEGEQGQVGGSCLSHCMRTWEQPGSFCQWPQIILHPPRVPGMPPPWWSSSASPDLGARELGRSTPLRGLTCAMLRAACIILEVSSVPLWPLIDVGSKWPCFQVLWCYYMMKGIQHPSQTIWL